MPGCYGQPWEFGLGDAAPRSHILLKTTIKIIGQP